MTNLMNNTKTRRKGSMLQDNLSKIKYLFVLAVLLVLPMQAMVAHGQGIPLVIDQTDTGVNRLVAFFDTRDRDTFVQVTNVSSSSVNIHVQVFDILSPFIECEECDFDDTLTANDTHVYDMENLVTNSGVREECPGITEETYGFVVISTTVLQKGGGPLIGTFRIIDESGYEYRTNAAGPSGPARLAFDEIVNFSEANGNNLSDLVGITFVSIDNSSVYASPGVATIFGSIGNEILIYDELEDDTSCSPTVFACAEGVLDRGIDNSLPNSAGEVNRVCATSTLNSNSSGWLDLPFAGFSCTDPAVGIAGECTEIFPPYFVGFIGLNNGNGTGSMDSWWEKWIGLLAE